MLDLKKLIEGAVDKVDFDITADASDVSDDIIKGCAKAIGSVVDHSGYTVLDGELFPSLEVTCARCGKEFIYSESIVLNAKITDKLANDDEDEFVLMQDGQVDIEELIRTTLILELPSRFLCRGDCKGLCPKCGADLNVAPCSCDMKERDPRWDALKGFFEE